MIQEKIVTIDRGKFYPDFKPNEDMNENYYLDE